MFQLLRYFDVTQRAVACVILVKTNLISIQRILKVRKSNHIMAIKVLKDTEKQTSTILLSVFFIFVHYCIFKDISSFFKIKVLIKNYLFKEWILRSKRRRIEKSYVDLFFCNNPQSLLYGKSSSFKKELLRFFAHAQNDITAVASDLTKEKRLIVNTENRPLCYPVPEHTL